MGYDQYTVPDTVAVKPTFVALLKQTPTYLLGLSCHSFNFLWRRVNSKPATIIPFGIVACTFSDNLSRNSCILVTTTLFPYSPLCGWPTNRSPSELLVFVSSVLWCYSFPSKQIAALSTRFNLMERKEKGSSIAGSRRPRGYQKIIIIIIIIINKIIISGLLEYFNLVRETFGLHFFSWLDY